MPDILAAENLKFINEIAYPKINIPYKKATFISGESGCGKSTLLKLFNATLTPIQGTVFFEGNDILTINTISLRRKVLLCGQSVFLFSGSIAYNFNKFAEYRGDASFTDLQIEEFLSVCCTSFKPTDLCDTMSGGEKQRVFIAICLAFKPQVLMLDEPTSALDTNTAHAIMQNIKNYCAANEITLVCVSHDKQITKEFADNVIYLTKAVN